MGDICPILSMPVMISGCSADDDAAKFSCIGRECVAWGSLPSEHSEGDEFLYDGGKRRGCRHFRTDYREMGWDKYDRRI